VGEGQNLSFNVEGYMSIETNVLNYIETIIIEDKPVYKDIIIKPWFD